MQRDTTVHCYNDGISISEKGSKVLGSLVNYLGTKYVSHLYDIILKRKIILPVIFQQNFYQVPLCSRH